MAITAEATSMVGHQHWPRGAAETAAPGAAAPGAAPGGPSIGRRGGPAKGSPQRVHGGLLNID